VLHVHQQRTSKGQATSYTYGLIHRPPVQLEGRFVY
jgi:hypothetical protein